METVGTLMAAHAELPVTRTRRRISWWAGQTRQSGPAANIQLTSKQRASTGRKPEQTMCKTTWDY
jgi:hypothetical protein